MTGWLETILKLVVAFFSVFMFGMKSKEVTALENMLEKEKGEQDALRSEADKWANRSRNPSELVERLRKRAEKRRKNKAGL